MILNFDLDLPWFSWWLVLKVSTCHLKIDTKGRFTEKNSIITNVNEQDIQLSFLQLLLSG